MKNILRKSNFGFTKWCVALIAAGWVGAAANAQTSVFSESMGTPTVTTAIATYATGTAPATFQNKATLTFTGTGDMRTSSASTTYTGASGGGNVFLTSPGPKEFQIAGINTTGFSTFSISFGVSRSAATQTLLELSLEYSSDGTTYTAISIPAQTAASGWIKLTLDNLSLPATSNLRLRFKNNSTALSGGQQFRLDDISLTAAAVFVVPTVTTSSSVSAISSSGATLGGSISNTGGANATETGIYYSTTTGFLNGTGTKVSTTGLNRGAGAFTQIVTGLSQNTTYYFKAFAANSAGPGYGTEQSFTTTAQSQAAPSVTAAPIATVDSNIEMTFTENASYRAAITDIKVGGASLPVQAFSTLSPGKIVLSPSASSLLQSSGSKTITITATGYEPVNVTQAISHGVATKLGILTQAVAPAANGGAFTTQPVVAVQDQYGNTVLTSTETVTAAVGTGDWILGGTVGVAAVNGVATFSGLTASKVGTLAGGTMGVSSGALTGVTSSGFNLPLPLLTVTTSGSYKEGVTGQTGTVSIPFVAPADIFVTLASSSAVDFKVDGNGNGYVASTTVVIATGTSSSEFFLDVPTDSTPDSNAAVTLTASATDFTNGTKAINVVNVDFNNPTVVINKFENATVDRIELIVVGNGTPSSTVDMRGMILKDHSGSNANDTGGRYVFASNPLWSAVPAGTIIVLTLDGTATDPDQNNFIIQVGLKNLTYFTVGTAGMDIASVDMVMIQAAGSTGVGSDAQIHALANGADTATQTAAAGLPKLVANVGNAGVVYAINANGVLADYNGTGVALGTKTFGTANSVSNASFLATLRGTSEISLSAASITLLDKAGDPSQATQVTLTMLPSPTVSTVVTLSSDQSGRLSLPATVTVPANTAEVTFTATATADGVDSGTVTANVTAQASNYNNGLLQLNVVDTDFTTPSVVINEYANNAPSDFVELLVLQDRLDMRGMILKDFSGTVASGDAGGRSQFTTNDLWSSVRAGTLIVITSDTAAVEDLDPDDFLLVVKRSNSLFFTNSGSFDIATSDVLMIKAAGSPFEGVSGSLHALAGGTPEGLYYSLTPWPKVITSSGSAAGFAVQLLTPTSSAADLNGSATGLAQGAATATAGTGNAPANTTYINGLKATSSLQAPEITSLPTASVQQSAPVSYTITANNNSGGTYGAFGLPVGLSVDSATGAISGSVAETGTYVIGLSAKNTDWVGVGILTLTVTQAPPVITSATSANGTVNTAFTYQITASYFPSSYGATGLPAGLTISTTTGLISGTPTVGGVFSVGLIASNSAGSGTATLDLTIPVPGTTYSGWLGTADPSDAAFLDYVFGAVTPGTLDASLKPTVAVTGGYLVLTYYVREGTVGLTVTPKTSSDLALGVSGWSTTGVEDVADVSPTTVNGVSVRKHTASVLVNGVKQQFLRVQADQQ